VAIPGIRIDLYAEAVDRKRFQYTENSAFYRTDPELAIDACTVCRLATAAVPSFLTTTTVAHHGAASEHSQLITSRCV
jgi:hypothetical protein